MEKMLGILGGMGPVVSAGFLQTIYEYTPQGNRGVLAFFGGESEKFGRK